MGTLADRVEWIFNNRAQADGRPWSARALSAAAGLSPSHVGQMRRGQLETPTADKLAGLARAARVSYRWLATGEGEPDDGMDAGPDPAADVQASPSQEDADHTRVAVFKNLANWPALLAAARSLEPQLPQWVWECLALANPLITAQPTPAMVAELARFIFRHQPPPPSRS